MLLLYFPHLETSLWLQHIAHIEMDVSNVNKPCSQLKSDDIQSADTAEEEYLAKAANGAGDLTKQRMKKRRRLDRMTWKQLKRMEKRKWKVASTRGIKD